MTDLHAPSTPDPGALAWRAFQQRPTFTALLALDGTVVEVNRAVEQRGFTREQFRGRHIADTPYFAADSSWQVTWHQRLAEVAGRGEPVGYEDTVTTIDGQVRFAEATVSPVRDQHGFLEWFLVEAEDTTERLQAELALREGERRFHDLLDALPLPAWSLDAAGTCDFVNQHWLDELGALPIREGRLEWTAVIHPDDLGAFELAWLRAQDARATLVGRYRLVADTGDVRDYEIRIAPVYGEESAAARWSAVAAPQPASGVGPGVAPAA